MIDMITMNEYGGDLLRLTPPVLRARGWRLYTPAGRLVDLWQYGGRAILGHKTTSLVRDLKNNAERGAVCSVSA